MVETMSDSSLIERLKVPRFKKLRITDLNPVLELFREMTKKLGQPVDKLSIPHRSLRKRGELKDQRARSSHNGGVSIGREDRVLKKPDVKKIGIALTSVRPITGMLRIGRYGQPLPYL
jgi:hypothetical protein